MNGWSVRDHPTWGSANRSPDGGYPFPRQVTSFKMGIPLNNNNRRSPTNTERVSGVEKTESAKQQTIIIAMAVVILADILAFDSIILVVQSVAFK
jgi:hypothetical protein